MRKLKNLKHIFVIIVISLSILFGSIRLFSEEFNDAMNGFFVYRTDGGRTNIQVWQDYIYKHTLRPSSSDIVIIKIDERTLNGIQSNANDLKNLTLTKETYTNLVRDLEGVLVKGIAFDIIFQNADPTYEQSFADTMAKYDNIVISANYIENFCQPEYKKTIKKLIETKASITGSATGVELGTIQDEYRENISNSECDAQYKSAYGALQKITGGENTPKNQSIEKIINLTGALTRAEQLILYCDTDSRGVIDCPGLPRSIYKDTPWGIIDTHSSYERTLAVPILGQPYQDWKVGSGNHSLTDTMFYPLALSLYNQTNAGTSDIISRLPSYPKKLERTVSQGENWKKSYSTILQPYFGAENISYPSISLIDVLAMSKVERKVNFKGKYVFVGEGGTLIHDELPSPVTGDMIDGVETHAHFLDGLLQNKMLSKPPAYSMEIASVILSILTVFFYFYLPNFLSPFFAIAMVGGTLWASRYLYDIHRMVVDIFPLFLSVFLTTFTTTYIYRFFVVDREKRFIENAFGHYIDPKMVEMIDMEEVAVTLGGEQRDLSVLFSDIAGFTTISEKLAPKDLFGLMSLYLSRMTDILKQEGGTLDKYIGDAVMGFFGAPITQGDHAIRACRTAVAMRKALPELNEEIARRGIIRVDFRVGIASGDVMIGNIGSEEHFNYTVLGDTVNLASRLEASGKEYNTHIIISEGTRSQIGSGFELRELDTIAVKGKTEGIKIYELLGLMGDKIDRGIYDIYEQALRLYRAGEYMEAGKIWESQMSMDPPSRVMALRCVEIIKGNIVVENGIYQMTHK